MDDLIEPVTAAKPRRKAAAAGGGGGTDAGVGAFRPKRARVTPEPQ